jgi:chorismate mutase
MNKKNSPLPSIRKSIDAVDRKIIALIAQRRDLAVSASSYKKKIRDNKRIKEVMASRKEWAIKKKIDPKVISRIYRILIKFCIKEQKKR